MEGQGFSRARRVAISVRGVFRSTWFSALLAVWYALVAMPTLPALSFGSPPITGGDSCVAACACVSCSGGDACCCALGAGASPALVATDDSGDTQDGPAWAPIDCAKKATWMTGLKAPAVPQRDAVVVAPPRPIAVMAVVNERAMPADPIGVPVPPPRMLA